MIICFNVYIFLYRKWKLHRKPSGVPPDLAMGVSILKPLTGIDPNLSANLETFFNMDYPTVGSHEKFLF